MKVTIKTREQLNQSTKGIAGAMTSWAEQMLLDKLAKYGRKTQFTHSYEVVAETEKAYKINVDDIYKNVGDDFVECEPWEMWMPKSACMAC